MKRILTSTLKDCLKNDKDAAANNNNNDSSSLQNTFIDLVLKELTQRFLYRYEAMIENLYNKMLKMKGDDGDNNLQYQAKKLPTKIVSPPSTTFSRQDAIQCFKGKRILFIGSAHLPGKEMNHALRTTLVGVKDLPNIQK